MPQTLHSDQNRALLELLRGAREQAGVTQVELAERTGMRQADVSKTERGVRRLDVIELHGWLTALGVPFVAFAARLDERLTALTLVRTQGKRRPQRA
jgi:transcriptional regulator with XRE-family HTH domain